MVRDMILCGLKPPHGFVMFSELWILMCTERGVLHIGFAHWPGAPAYRSMLCVAVTLLFAEPCVACRTTILMLL
jgi:hypothetical protein